MTRRLSDIAHARSGDKGAGANIGVIAYTRDGYDLIRQKLTADAVETFFKPMRPGKVTRYELPNLLALNFVLSEILDGGGSVSLRIDAQGKALGQAILQMPIDLSDDLLEKVQATMIKLDSHDATTSILTLNRPDKRNALSLELIGQITSAIKQLESDKAKRVLIIRAEGPAFCAGLDLAEASAPDGAGKSAHALATMYEAVCETPLVTIGAVTGAAVGGGAGLAIACDFVLASSEDFKLGFPEVHRGIVAALVTAILRRQVNDRTARELILLGRTIDAQRALELGLSNRVVARDQMMDESLKLARQVCRGAPNAIVRSKRLLDDLSPRPIREEFARALKYHLEARSSAEALEGVKAFVEKREPKWNNRD